MKDHFPQWHEPMLPLGPAIHAVYPITVAEGARMRKDIFNRMFETDNRDFIGEMRYGKPRAPGTFMAGDRVRYTKDAKAHWQDAIGADSFLWSKVFVVTEQEGHYVLFADGEGHEYPQWLELVF